MECVPANVGETGPKQLLEVIESSKYMIQKMPQSIGVQISAPVLKLAVFVQHGGRPSAFRQNSADCHAETNSSFQMQTIRDSRSNHHVH